MAHDIATDLQVDTILDAVLAEFEKELLPLHAFATEFKNVPLSGTDDVVVKFRPVHNKTVTDFNQANGYVTLEESDLDSKKVTVDQRKYVGVEFKSVDLSRQPELDRANIVIDAARDLAEAVLTDVWGFITAANGFAVVHTGAAANFDLDDIIDIKDILDTVDGSGNEAWPSRGRRMIVKPAYSNNLLRQSLFHEADKAGTTQFRDTGLIGRDVVGFDFTASDFIPDNGENLVGACIQESGILVASAPVPPKQGSTQVVDYRSVESPISGLTLEYRQWFDPDYDKLKEVVEFNYGRAIGYEHAIKRLVSA